MGIVYLPFQKPQVLGWCPGYLKKLFKETVQEYRKQKNPHFFSPLQYPCDAATVLNTKPLISLTMESWKQDRLAALEDWSGQLLL